MAGGNYLAGWLSGGLYGKMADKSVLLTNDLVNRGIEVPEISDAFTKTDLFVIGQDALDMNAKEMTQYLWETYNPSDIWMIFTGIGIGCFVMLYMYNKFVPKR